MVFLNCNIIKELLNILVIQNLK